MIIPKQSDKCLTLTLRLPYDCQSFDKILDMLALVGSGEYLPPMELVDRYLLEHLPGSPRVVCLPTAAGTEGLERINYWSKLGVEHFTKLGVPVETLPVIDSQSANDFEFAERIHQANFIYLSGGKPNYLLSTLKNSLAWQAIEAVLTAGGLLAGCSAGAMVMGERIAGFSNSQPAFNLVPNSVIIPHYDEIPAGFSRLARISNKNATMLGIEGNTALFIDQTNAVVIGLGGITLWNRLGKQRYTHGQTIVSW